MQTGDKAAAVRVYEDLACGNCAHAMHFLLNEVSLTYCRLLTVHTAITAPDAEAREPHALPRLLYGRYDYPTICTAKQSCAATADMSVGSLYPTTRANKGWDALGEVRRFSSHDVEDAQAVAWLICDPQGEGLAEHFGRAAHIFLTGVVLHVLYAEDKGTIAGVAEFLNDPCWDSDKQIYLHMMQAEHDPEGKSQWCDAVGRETKSHPYVAQVARSMMDRSDSERLGVLSTARVALAHCWLSRGDRGELVGRRLDLTRKARAVASSAEA